MIPWKGRTPTGLYDRRGTTNRTLAFDLVRGAKDQGLWPDMTDLEEAQWHEGFAEWSRESVDGPDSL
jgi:hypothetical protein